MKLSELVHKRLPQYTVYPDYLRPHHQTSIGIELEVEGISRNATGLQNLKRWTVTDDPSVPEGIEIISDPVWGSAIQDALNEIHQLYELHPPSFSDKCSTHIHLNILDMQPKELYEMLLMYLKYEDIFYYLSPSRKNNIFCVPASECLGYQRGFITCLNDLLDQTPRSGYFEYKYCGLNLNSIEELGTVEFRHLKGTRDIQEINNFINLILQLKASAQLGLTKDSDPKDIFMEYYDIFKVESCKENSDVFNYLKLKGVL